MADISNSLAAAVAAAGISSPAEFEALALQLTPPEKALFVALSSAPGQLDTVELRAASAGLLANVSAIARAINRKLSAAGDDRRLACSVAPRAGGRGSSGTWRIESLEAERASA